VVIPLRLFRSVVDSASYAAAVAVCPRRTPTTTTKEAATTVNGPSGSSPPPSVCVSNDQRVSARACERTTIIIIVISFNIMCNKAAANTSTRTVGSVVADQTDCRYCAVAVPVVE